MNDLSNILPNVLKKKKEISFFCLSSYISFTSYVIGKLSYPPPPNVSLLRLLPLLSQELQRKRFQLVWAEVTWRHAHTCRAYTPENLESLPLQTLQD